MSKFELSLAENYVASWGVIEGVREIFQNALDQQTQDPTNEMFYDYDIATKKLSIGNKKSVLSTQTLLLGCTTKAGVKEQIGQFGEGYKIATLALIRAGYNVTFYNYGVKEIWRPRFVESKRYGAKVLTFFTEKHVWTKVPDHDLTIVIECITGDIWARIKESNLHVRGDIGKVYDTPYGRILTEDTPGCVYVNGLLVKKLDGLKYAYDVKPAYLSLDRDRRMLQTYNVTWITAQMLAATDDKDLIQGVLNTQYQDAVDLHYQDYKVSDSTRSSICSSFVDRYGSFAIPVSSQSDLETVQAKYKDAKPVMVIASEKVLVTSASNWKVNAEEVTTTTSVERLILWKATYGSLLSGKASQELQDIINDMLPEKEDVLADDESAKNEEAPEAEKIANNLLEAVAAHTEDEGDVF